MVAKLLILSALVAAAAAIAIPVGVPVTKVAYAEQELPANYEFAYSVHDDHSGDIKEQKEVRSGYAVQGSYSLVQPDGVHRIVDYTADKEHGFNAIVRYEGTPIAAPAPAKIAYAAPVAKVAYAAAPVSYAAAPVSYAAPVTKIAYSAPVTKIAYQAPISYASAPVTKVAYAQAPISYAAAPVAKVAYASAPVAKVAYAENLGHVTFSSPSVTYHH